MTCCVVNCVILSTTPRVVNRTAFWLASTDPLTIISLPVASFVHRATSRKQWPFIWHVLRRRLATQTVHTQSGAVAARVARPRRQCLRVRDNPLVRSSCPVVVSHTRWNINVAPCKVYRFDIRSANIIWQICSPQILRHHHIGGRKQR